MSNSTIIITTNKHILSNFKRNAYICAVLLTISNFRASAFLHNNFKLILITYKNPIPPTLLFSISKEVDSLCKHKRASLHPVIINSILQALLERSTGKLPSTRLEVANAAGRIATNALEKGCIALKADNDKEMTPLEWQTICGRVVDVITRFKELELILCAKVKNVEWVTKY